MLRRVCAHFKSADCVDANKITTLNTVLIRFVLIYDFRFTRCFNKNLILIRFQTICLDPSGKKSYFIWFSWYEFCFLSEQGLNYWRLKICLNYLVRATEVHSTWRKLSISIPIDLNGVLLEQEPWTYAEIFSRERSVLLFVLFGCGYKNYQ